MKAYRGYGEPNQTATHVLDCPQCGGWFENFTTLAAHVTKVHRPTSTQVTDSNERDTNAQHERERDDMLPRSSRPEPARKQKNAARIPGSARSTQSNDYNPFLKAHDIGKLGATAKLTLTGEVRVTNGEYGEQIIAEVRLGRINYDWPIKLNSPNHRELEDTLGLNAAKWRNKVVAVEVKEHMGRDYIAVQRARKQNAVAKKKTAKRKR